LARFSAVSQLRLPLRVPRFNAAPTQQMPVVVQEGQERHLVAMR